MSYWRMTSRAVIGQVLQRHRGLGDKELRKILSEAYPFGERAHWPYKVWLSEVKRQLKRAGRLRMRRDQVDGGGDPIQPGLFDEL